MPANARGKMIGASMGDCVHVAGVLGFLRLAQDQGYDTEFLGAALMPESIAALAKERGARFLAVGYRLDPNAAKNLIRRLKAALDREGISPTLLFGGTPPVAKAAKESGIFDAVFSGVEDIDEIIAFLKGESALASKTSYPSNLVQRIAWKSPYPILRHHFGLPSLEETEKGIAKIAEAGVIDVISLGPDQNAQENFFRPREMDKDQDGAGGVPVRSEDDFQRLYEASRRGNYPLMRCYSGTRDVLRFADVLARTIHNAWAAIPLLWYNVLDKRGPRTVVESVSQAQENLRWHAKRGIPCEVNESHHWSLRDAPDVVAVAAAYLAAYNAKKAGVRHYVSQYMFNTPPGMTAEMDLAKMLAKDELIRSLEDESFAVYRQVRAGLSSFPVDPGLAKGQLATSTLVSMNMKPHIVHVVGFCEGDHIAKPEDVIESAKISRGVIRNCLDGMPDMTKDDKVQARKIQLMAEAKTLLRAVAELPSIAGLSREKKIGREYDPYTDAENLALAVKVGLLDAPHLVGNPYASGTIQTSMVNGACVALDPETKMPISEEIRVEKAIARYIRLKARTVIATA